MPQPMAAKAGGDKNPIIAATIKNRRMMKNPDISHLSLEGRARWVAET
jgi:hypothetical protein